MRNRVRRVQDFWTRIFSYTLNISKNFCFMFISSSRSANTNFFYSVYLYRWLAYLTYISGDPVGSGATRRALVHSLELRTVLFERFSKPRSVQFDLKSKHRPTAPFYSNFQLSEERQKLLISKTLGEISHLTYTLSSVLTNFLFDDIPAKCEKYVSKFYYFLFSQ